MSDIKITIKIPESEWENWNEAENGIEFLKRSLSRDLDREVYQLGIRKFTIHIESSENENE